MTFDYDLIDLVLTEERNGNVLHVVTILSTQPAVSLNTVFIKIQERKEHSCVSYQLTVKISSWKFLPQTVKYKDSVIRHLSNRND